MSTTFLTEKGAADYLQVAPATLSRWRWAGKGPIFRKFEGAVRYALSDLEAFAAGSRIERGTGI